MEAVSELVLEVLSDALFERPLAAGSGTGLEFSLGLHVRLAVRARERLSLRASVSTRELAGKRRCSPVVSGGTGVATLGSWGKGNRTWPSPPRRSVPTVRPDRFGFRSDSAASASSRRRAVWISRAGSSARRAASRSSMLMRRTTGGRSRLATRSFRARSRSRALCSMLSTKSRRARDECPRSAKSSS